MTFKKVTNFVLIPQTFRAAIDSLDIGKGYLLPETWRQGRTAYGGLTAALTLAAAHQSESAQLPPLRSAQVSFIAPATEVMTFQPAELRKGKSVVTMNVDCFSGDTLAARSSFVFARDRDSQIHHAFHLQPDVKSPTECPAIPEQGQKLMPDFARHFDIRPAGGSLPLSGAVNPELLAWARHRDADQVHPEVALLGLADCLPPAAFTAYTTPAPISSVNWSLDFIAPVSANGWFLLRSFSRQAGNGYSSQEMEIWDESGNLVSIGRQLVAIF